MIALRVQCDECPRHVDIDPAADSAGRISGGMFDARRAAQYEATITTPPDAIFVAMNGKPWIELDITEVLPDDWHVEERGGYPPIVYIRCPEHAP